MKRLPIPRVTRYGTPNGPSHEPLGVAALRIAIVGTGIAGLSAAWALNRRHAITVFEAENRPGGHSHTIEVPTQHGCLPVDTGFIVYNEVTYPLLTRLFDHLGVATQWSDMSFSASIDGGRLEYAGSSAAAVLAQARNMARPGFLRMLVDIERFNRLGCRLLASEVSDEATLGEFLDRHRFGAGIRRWYLLPMAAAIWSAPVAQILRFPARSFLSFFANHGLLSIAGQHRWRTVRGGARRYVERMVAEFRPRLRLGTPIAALRRLPWGAELRCSRGEVWRFDHVVLACHADQALRLLQDAEPDERAFLERFCFQPNRAVLHGDPALMPRRRKVWSSWNYLARSGQAMDAAVSVTYWMNRLQGLDPEVPLFLSMNPLCEPAPETVHALLHYDHPVIDAPALAMQGRLPQVQGRGGVWYAGAWLGYGFHEDGARSGLDVARALGAAPPWEATPAPAFGFGIGLPEQAAAQAP